jgi:hypothetical protein
MASDETIERRLHELRVVAADYAKAESERSYLSEYRKSKKAMLMVQAEHRGAESVAKQERDAYADPEYRSLLESLKEATEKAERLRWELEVARMGAELWRTQQANQRAERKGYGA